MTVEPMLSRYSEGYDPPVRGDRITAERYIGKDWMELEHRNLWPRVWHLGGVLADLEEEGDFIRHNFAKESVVMNISHATAPAKWTRRNAVRLTLPQGGLQGEGRWARGAALPAESQLTISAPETWSFWRSPGWSAELPQCREGCCGFPATTTRSKPGSRSTTSIS